MADPTQAAPANPPIENEDDFVKAFETGLAKLDEITKAMKHEPPPPEPKGEEEEEAGEGAAPYGGEESEEEEAAEAAAKAKAAKAAKGKGKGKGEEKESFKSILAEMGVEPMRAPDGVEVVPIEATPLLAAFDRRNETLAKSVAALTSLTIAQAEQITAQGRMLKAMAGEIAEIGSAGRGRKSVLSVFTKAVSDGSGTTAGAAAAAQPNQAQRRDEILAKCVAASAEGKILPEQVAQINFAAQRGIPLSADLAAAIGA